MCCCGVRMAVHVGFTRSANRRICLLMRHQDPTVFRCIGGSAV
jgi:hypothetical protein